MHDSCQIDLLYYIILLVQFTSSFYYKVLVLLLFVIFFSYFLLVLLQNATLEIPNGVCVGEFSTLAWEIFPTRLRHARNSIVYANLALWHELCNIWGIFHYLQYGITLIRIQHMVGIIFLVDIGT